MKLSALLLLSFISGFCFGQANSESIYKVGEPAFDQRICIDSARVRVKFLDQNDVLIKTQMSVILVNDTVSMTLEKDDMRSTLVPNGVQRLRFISEIGYNLTTAPMKFPAKGVVTMEVKMIGSPVLLDDIFYDL